MIIIIYIIIMIITNEVSPRAPSIFWFTDLQHWLKCNPFSIFIIININIIIITNIVVVVVVAVADVIILMVTDTVTMPLKLIIAFEFAHLFLDLTRVAQIVAT